MAIRRTVSDRPPRGRREHRKHLTRRELLAAGRRLFAEKGLYDSRVEDLSRLAGIAKGTLYGYFANKEELIEAVVTSGFSELLGHVHRAAQGAKSRKDGLARVVEAHLTFFMENPDLMRIFHQLRGLLKFSRVESRALRDVLAKYLASLEQILATLPVNQTPEPDHTEAAFLLFGAISGITSLRASIPSGDPRSNSDRRIVRGVVGLVVAYESSSPGRGARERRGA